MSMSRGWQLIGKMLNGYVLERLLGHGGSSAVYLARLQQGEQRVAIKVFLPRATLTIETQRDFYRRFLHEAEAASKLHHPHILPILDYGSQDGLPYIIMPYMPGGTLRDVVVQHGPLSLADARRYLEQIASALDYAHAQGFVHCDVKPANVLLDSDGNALLADFGIARVMAAEMAVEQEQAVVSQDEDTAKRAALATSSTINREATNREATNRETTRPPETLMGTPDYISPEQALAQQLDGRSDLYSLGVTLFYLLVGHVPFQADASVTIALMQVHEPPPAASLWRVDITPGIDAVLYKAMAKIPQDRYQSAGELSRAFAGAVEAAAQSHGVNPGEKPVLRQPASKASAKTPQKLHIAAPSVRIVPLSSRRRRPLQLRERAIMVAVIALTVALVIGAFLAYLSHSSAGLSSLATSSPGATNPVDELSLRNDWPVGAGFAFSGQQYDIDNISARYAELALFADHEYSDFRLTITAAEVHGSQDGADYYGVILRSSADQSHYYLFEVAAWGGGQFQFLRYDGSQQWKVLDGGPVPSFLTALRSNNIISVEAQGNAFHFQVNGKSIGLPVSDTSSSAFTSGEIGLYVEEQGTEVAFSHLYMNSAP
jgi:serine/threonine protein kinase